MLGFTYFVVPDGGLVLSNFSFVAIYMLYVLAS
jgi:hypothetical protein